jgi:pimeloyl-ACP methyl ester carboxylesterase
VIDLNEIEVGGRTFRYVCGGNGAPPVVLEQGYGSPPDASFREPASRGWRKVFQEIQGVARVITYGRADLERKHATTPRTCRDMVNDLRTLLQRADISPPYILVGHSFGGLIVQLYASEYPDEVAGVVLVDSSHPDQSAKFAEVLPPESAGDAPVLKRFRRAPNLQIAGEAIDLAASAAEVRGASSRSIKRLVVLSHSPRSAFHPGISAELSEKLEQVWLQLQMDLLQLSSSSTHRIAAAASHLIQIDEPQLVVDAIIEVVRDARANSILFH